MKSHNYDAIEVSEYAAIPCDYFGVMGVPITFLDHYNPDQFEILGCNRDIDQDLSGIYGRGSDLNGRETYKRIFIRRRVAA
ncbi:MAG: adenine-specific methyltransferase EcoRI family protein [Stenotrophobium sp.]